MNTILLILTISLIDLSFKGWRDSHSEPWGGKVEGVSRLRRMQRDEGGERKQENNKQADPPTGQ